MKDPEAFLKQLTSDPYNFKLKGSGELNFHLGCGFARDADSTLYMDRQVCRQDGRCIQTTLWRETQPEVPFSLG